MPGSIVDSGDKTQNKNVSPQRGCTLSYIAA